MKETKEEKLPASYEQYLNIKNKHKDDILLFRIGDFYEVYFEDADICSKILSLRLGFKIINNQKISKCGFSYHIIEESVEELVRNGYKVAICEQIKNSENEESTDTESKVIKREVVKIITPGTILSSRYLDNEKNNYLMSLYYSNTNCGISVVDIGTGEFLLYQLVKVSDTQLIDEITTFSPSEIICNKEFLKLSICGELKNNFSILITEYTDEHFEYKNAYNTLCKQFSEKMLETKNLSTQQLSICSAGAIVSYLFEVQKELLKNIDSFEIYNNNFNMLLDYSARRNLELTETLQERTKKGSLLWILDRTRTKLGARLLRKWLEKPEISIRKIENRLKSVEELNNDLSLRDDIITNLNNIGDIERLVAKILSSVKVPDLLKLKSSLFPIPKLYKLLSSYNSYYLKKIYTEMEEDETLKHISEIYDL